MRERFDIIVTGAGMVGACAALALAHAGFRIALLEAGSVDHRPGKDKTEYGERVSAISPASEQILTRLGVWQEMDSSRVCRYDQMFIWHENGDASIHFDSVELARDSLGNIIENQQILRALLLGCESQSQIEWFVPDTVESITENSDSRVLLTLDSGAELEADLLLVADGRNSSTRRLAGLNTNRGNYHQTAIVANVITAHPHQHTAWQRFLSTGPLALLPLANGQSSIVWSCDTGLAEQLIDMDDESFCDALSHASEYKLGEVSGIGKRLSFPLGWHTCDHWLRGRTLLIGDAAHGVHPLAGQGVNLGFSDVDLLARLIGGPGNHWRRAKLRQFERQRKSETVLATHLFGSLKWIYGTDNAALSRLRNFGMQLVQDNAWCRRRLMQQAIRNMA
jgi:ubiquinone biosynthesis UbiH/UbiF/VisC/COQ6 family hydroxylase